VAANEAEKLLSGAFPQRWKLLRRIQDQAGKYTAFTRLQEQEKRKKEKGDLELMLSMSNILVGPPGGHQQTVGTEIQDIIRNYFSDN
jgi:hypothetical protein